MCRHWQYADSKADIYPCLLLSIADTSIAEPETHEGEDWGFHIKGKRVGQTSIEISIFHNDHPDFVSRPIPIVVN